MRPHRLALAALAVSLLATVPADLHARTTHRRHRAQATNSTAPIPALFLSDVHFDPFADPSKVAQLNSATEAQWQTILASPDSPNRAADFAALQKACPVRGIDTNNAVWQSSLDAIRQNAASPRFVVLTGDLLAHEFDCKFHRLLPDATQSDYLAFTQKTVEYVFTPLRAATSSVPLYLALGNNDSGCTDYSLDDAHDPFLANVLPLVLHSLPHPITELETREVTRDFSTLGSYSAPLTGVPNTRVIALDDLFLSSKYTTCSGSATPAPAAAQLAWLQRQLSAARAAHQHVWVLGHIPPGVNLYGTARARLNICAGAVPQMYLGSEKLEEILAANADIIRLTLFGHTHSDEIRLLTPESPATGSRQLATAAGVPLKIIASITPVNGNNPTFTLAQVDPATANLADYTVIAASNSNGVATTWSPEYTYSAAYHQPAFDAASVSTLISGFQSDPTAQTPASQVYLRNYEPGSSNLIIQLAWPQYACSMNHDSAASFTACACATLK